MASTYTWTLQSGTVPPGMSLSLGETDLDITLSGTPTTAGTYVFTVRITNDVSGAFDDQQFTVVVLAGVLQITPDVGLPTDQAFDGNINSKLVENGLTALVDLGASADVAAKYKSRNDLRIQADVGSGVSVYQIPTDQLRNVVALNQPYLLRVVTDVNTVLGFTLI